MDDRHLLLSELAAQACAGRSAQGAGAEGRGAGHRRACAPGVLRLQSAQAGRRTHAARTARPPAAPVLTRLLGVQLHHGLELAPLHDDVLVPQDPV